MANDEKVFNDAVHGTISLPPLCVKIIDTPLFQRLRHLKQLGTAYRVYPSAAHNRFEHSIGVCHLAGQLARALKSRQEDYLDDKDILCVQIAALCHDLGHGPFSHVWEEFLKKAGVEWAHEDQSVEVFKKIRCDLASDFTNTLSPHDIIFIMEMIRGKELKDEDLIEFGLNNAMDQNTDWQLRGRGMEKRFLYEIVANKETGVDVDKWDYFLRDGHALGIKVTFDHKRLIQFCRVGKNHTICFRDKVVTDLYDLFHARAGLHHKACQHRVVRILDEMHVDAFLEAFNPTEECSNGNCNPRNCIIHAFRNLDAFQCLTDDLFNQILHKVVENEHEQNANQILNNIIKRKLYKAIGEVTVTEERLMGVTKATWPETKKQMEKNLLDILMAIRPTDSNLAEKHLAISTIKIDYGMMNENPIKKIKFYAKGIDTIDGETMVETYPDILQPKRFLVVKMLVICKSYEDTSRRDAEAAFENLKKLADQEMDQQTEQLRASLNLELRDALSWMIPRMLRIDSPQNNQIQGQDAPVQDAPVQDAPIQDALVQDAPVQDAPVQNGPA